MFNFLYMVVCPRQGKQPYTKKIKYLAAAGTAALLQEK